MCEDPEIMLWSSSLDVIMGLPIFLAVNQYLSLQLYLELPSKHSVSAQGIWKSLIPFQLS